MSSVQSVERAFSILRALSPSPSGVSAIAVQVGLPKSTVSRLLATLETVGAVERVEDSFEYRLGALLGELGGSVDASAALSAAVTPDLVRLAETLGEAAGFAVPVGYGVLFVVQSEGPNPVQVRDYSGLTLPMHVVPSGLVMMAGWPNAEVSRYLARPLEAYTPNTLVDPRQIVERLQRIRTDGFCWGHEEYAEGISSVASPVVDGNHKVLGAIHVHGPTYRFPSPGSADRVASAVRDAADGFSRRRT